MNTYKKLLGLVLVLGLAAIAGGCTTKAQRQDIIINNASKYMSEGNYAQAIELLNEGLALAEGRVGDKEIDISYDKAAAQYNSGDYEGAIKTYTALANYDEDDPNPLFLRGSVYLKSGEKATALNDYKAAIKLDEKDYDLYIAIYENLAANNFIKEGEEFLKENAGKPGVITLKSGLQYKVLKEGSGRKPGKTSKVRCHYEGTFTNGMTFDSSYKRGEPAVFGVNQVIAGWTEALQLMSEGSEWELYIPYQLAYGEAGAHGAIPPCAALVFKVELIEVL